MGEQEYLPDVYLSFRDRFPAVAAAVDKLAESADAAGPLDERTVRLVKLGLAVGGLAEGAVRSNARRALSAGATPAEIWQVVALAVTTSGFPSAVAAFGWIREVLEPAVPGVADRS